MELEPLLFRSVLDGVLQQFPVDSSEQPPPKNWTGWKHVTRALGLDESGPGDLDLVREAAAVFNGAERREGSVVGDLLMVNRLRERSYVLGPGFGARIIGEQTERVQDYGDVNLYRVRWSLPEGAFATATMSESDLQAVYSNAGEMLSERRLAAPAPSVPGGALQAEGVPPGGQQPREPPAQTKSGAGAGAGLQQLVQRGTTGDPGANPGQARVPAQAAGTGAAVIPARGHDERGRGREEQPLSGLDTRDSLVKAFGAEFKRVKQELVDEQRQRDADMQQDDQPSGAGAAGADAAQQQQGRQAAGTRQAGAQQQQQRQQGPPKPRRPPPVYTDDPDEDGPFGTATMTGNLNAAFVAAFKESARERRRQENLAELDPALEQLLEEHAARAEAERRRQGGRKQPNPARRRAEDTDEDTDKALHSDKDAATRTDRAQRRREADVEEDALNEGARERVRRRDVDEGAHPEKRRRTDPEAAGATATPARGQRQAPPQPQPLNTGAAQTLPARAQTVCPAAERRADEQEQGLHPCELQPAQVAPKANARASRLIARSHSGATWQQLSKDLRAGQLFPGQAAAGANRGPPQPGGQQGAAQGTPPAGGGCHSPVGQRQAVSPATTIGSLAPDEPSPVLQAQQHSALTGHATSPPPPQQQQRQQRMASPPPPPQLQSALKQQRGSRRPIPVSLRLSRPSRPGGDPTVSAGVDKEPAVKAAAMEKHGAAAVATAPGGRGRLPAEAEAAAEEAQSPQAGPATTGLQRAAGQAAASGGMQGSVALNAAQGEEAEAGELHSAADTDGPADGGGAGRMPPAVRTATSPDAHVLRQSRGADTASGSARADTHSAAIARAGATCGGALCGQAFANGVATTTGTALQLNSVRSVGEPPASQATIPTAGRTSVPATEQPRPLREEPGQGLETPREEGERRQEQRASGVDLQQGAGAPSAGVRVQAAAAAGENQEVVQPVALSGQALHLHVSHAVQTTQSLVDRQTIVSVAAGERRRRSEAVQPPQQPGLHLPPSLSPSQPPVPSQRPGGSPVQPSPPLSQHQQAPLSPPSPEQQLQLRFTSGTPSQPQSQPRPSQELPAASPPAPSRKLSASPPGAHPTDLRAVPRVVASQEQQEGLVSPLSPREQLPSPHAQPTGLPAESPSATLQGDVATSSPVPSTGLPPGLRLVVSQRQVVASPPSPLASPTESPVVSPLATQQELPVTSASALSHERPTATPPKPSQEERAASRLVFPQGQPAASAMLPSQEEPDASPQSYSQRAADVWSPVPSQELSAGRPPLLSQKLPVASPPGLSPPLPAASPLVGSQGQEAASPGARQREPPGGSPAAAPQEQGRQVPSSLQREADAVLPSPSQELPAARFPQKLPDVSPPESPQQDANVSPLSRSQEEADASPSELSQEQPDTWRPVFSQRMPAASPVPPSQQDVEESPLPLSQREAGAPPPLDAEEPPAALPSQQEASALSPPPSRQKRLATPEGVSLLGRPASPSEQEAARALPQGSLLSDGGTPPTSPRSPLRQRLYPRLESQLVPPMLAMPTRQQEEPAASPRCEGQGASPPPPSPRGRLASQLPSPQRSRNPSAPPPTHSHLASPSLRQHLQTASPPQLQPGREEQDRDGAAATAAEEEAEEQQQQRTEHRFSVPPGWQRPPSGQPLDAGNIIACMGPDCEPEYCLDGNYCDEGCEEDDADDPSAAAWVALGSPPLAALARAAAMRPAAESEPESGGEEEADVPHWELGAHELFPLEALDDEEEGAMGSDCEADDCLESGGGSGDDADKPEAVWDALEALPYVALEAGPAAAAETHGSEGQGGRNADANEGCPGDGGRVLGHGVGCAAAVPSADLSGVGVREQPPRDGNGDAQALPSRAPGADGGASAGVGPALAHQLPQLEGFQPAEPRSSPIATCAPDEDFELQSPDIEFFTQPADW